MVTYMSLLKLVTIVIFYNVLLVKISAIEQNNNDTEVTISNSEVTITDIEVTINDREVTINGTEVTINDTRVTSNDPVVIINNAGVTVNDSRVTINETELTIKDPEAKILSRTKRGDRFDFGEVIKLNNQYANMPNKCSLRQEIGKILAKEGDVPYQVAFRRESKPDRHWDSFCSGAIITHLHVVTAARCFYNVNKKALRATAVVAGTNRPNVRLFGTDSQRRTLLAGLQTIEVWRKIVACYTHARYNKQKDRNDIAVLKVDEPYKFSDMVKAIPMMSKDMELSEKSLCVTSAYGIPERRSPSPTLILVCVPVVDFKKCGVYYGKKLNSNNTQVCAGFIGRDAFQADFGSPLVCEGVLTGILSFSDSPMGPGVYSLLSAYTASPKISFRASISKSLSSKIDHSLLGIIVSLAFAFLIY